MNFANASEHDNTFEVETAVAELTATTKAALTKNAGDIKELGSTLAKLQAKMGRPWQAGTAANDNEPSGLATATKALGSYARTGDDSEMKALSVGSDPDGGYTVTPELSMMMTKRIYDQSPIRQLCRSVTIGAGDAFEEPLDMLGDLGASWVGENEARPATATPVIGLLRVACDEVYSLQPITQRLLDDSRFDIGAWVTEKIADKFARTEGLAFVSGDGVNKPKGFMTYATSTTPDLTRAIPTLQHVVSGGATTVNADGLRDLFWTVRAPHRANGTWLMSSATANAIDKLKTGDGEYLWRNGMSAGVGPTVLGRPVVFSEDMAAIGAGTFPIAFGDFQTGYLIVDKLGLRILRDPFSSKPNVLFYAYKRVGGGVANSDAIKLLKVSA